MKNKKINDTVYFHTNKYIFFSLLLLSTLFTFADTPDYLALGKEQENQQQYAKAAHLYAKAVAQNPRNPEAHFRLGSVLLAQEKFSDAITCFRAVLTINPMISPALFNIAYITLHNLGKCQESIPLYQQFLALNPDHKGAHLGLACAYLAVEDFEHGWPAWERGRLKSTDASFLKNQQDIPGKTILIFEEWGFGDTFQFIRYAQLIKKAGGRVIVRARTAVASILSLCDCIDHLVIAGQPMPTYDYVAPLISLPGIFQTNLTNIPTEPYLHADETLVKEWHDKLVADTTFRVGISWKGSSAAALLKRHIAAALFAQLATIAGVKLYSLQQDGSVDLKSLPNNPIVDFGPELDTVHGPFMDTAAIMMNMNLMITIDTAVAHLAGGLGIPVWNLLPHIADWRWFLNREDSPWYPTMRLFRQKNPDDWQEVMNRVAQELAHTVAEWRKSHHA